jgi:hypothetical protein
MKTLLLILFISFYISTVSAQHHIIRVGGIPQGSFAMGINGSYLLAGAYGANSLRCFDLSNAALSLFTDSLTLSGYPAAITFNNTFALVGGDGFISLINMSNPQNLSITATVPISGQVHGLYFYNDMLFALRAQSNSNFRLLRYAVNLPGSLSLLDSIFIPDAVTKMLGTADGRIFMARGESFSPERVQILNISGGNFTPVATIPALEVFFLSFDVLGNTLYMNYPDSMYIINISTPL